MNRSIEEQAVMLPTDLERRQIFHWLKRVSSVTAWRRISGFYEAWATSVENSLRMAEERGWHDETSLPQTEYRLILNCLAHCKEGINRLIQGDKHVFKFDADGEFIKAQRMLSHWTKMLERIELGENGIKKHTPLWSEFCEALMAAASAWGECGPPILEQRYLDAPALTLYGVWMQDALKSMLFPEKLTFVTDPVENTLVRTGKVTPCFGMWESIVAPTISRSALLSVFTTALQPVPPFKIAGAMNYLHGGSTAPQITVETAHDNINIATIWRLLWRDDRYENGTIPDEEAYYQFCQPQPIKVPRPAV